jgi:hypothetical protein
VKWAIYVAAEADPRAVIEVWIAEDRMPGTEPNCRRCSTARLRMGPLVRKQSYGPVGGRLRFGPGRPAMAVSLTPIRDDPDAGGTQARDEPGLIPIDRSPRRRQA